MNKAQIERMDDLRRQILDVCLSIKSCRHCPLILEPNNPHNCCAGVYLSRTLSPKKENHKK